MYENESGMTFKDIEQYRSVQQIAKDTIAFLCSYIQEGVTEREIVETAEKYMRDKGVCSFWYHNIGAFVFVGERTTISISGREYKPTDTKVKADDLVTVDLAPAINGFWGDFARSFVIQKGKMVEPEQSTSSEVIEGIAAETRLHLKFREFITQEMSLGEIYIRMNLLINELGFENLDFKGNLGHSIETQIGNRVYIESGNDTKFGELRLFTFEPHIRRKNGKYGFKHEEIYFFNEGKLEVL